MDARVVVLRGGSEGAFCAGASFDELAAIAGVDAGTDTGTAAMANAGDNTGTAAMANAGDNTGTGGDTVAETSANAGRGFFAGFARVINAMRRRPKFIIARVHVVRRR